jgi:hypothetical protein
VKAICLHGPGWAPGHKVLCPLQTTSTEQVSALLTAITCAHAHASKQLRLARPYLTELSALDCASNYVNSLTAEVMEDLTYADLTSLHLVLDLSRCGSHARWQPRSVEQAWLRSPQLSPAWNIQGRNGLVRHLLSLAQLDCGAAS